MCLILTQCTSTVPPPSLQGLWCGDAFCSYFLEDSCMMYWANFYPYQIIEDTILVKRKPNPVSKYHFQFKYSGDTTFLIINERPYESFYKVMPKHAQAFKTLTYSLLSDLDELNLILKSDGTFELEVIFTAFAKIKPGYYKGKLNSRQLLFYKELIGGIDLEIDSELNPTIVSDIEEWAIIITDAHDNTYHLYHNYKTITNLHHALNTHLATLPAVATLDTLQEINPILKEAAFYRVSEFQRNVGLE